VRALRTRREIAEAELLDARIELQAAERAKDVALAAYSKAYLREKNARTEINALVDVPEGATP
jgi:hypothetical protein